MRSFSVALALFLTACPGGATPSDTDVDTDIPTPLPRTDEGSLSLIRVYENSTFVSSDLYGVFVSDGQEFINIAQCVSDERMPCLTELPEVGESLVYDRDIRFRPDQAAQRFVGLSIPFGPYETFYQADDELSWYRSDVFLQGDVTGPVALTVSDEWGDYTVDPAINVPDPLLIEAPFVEGGTLNAFSDEEAFRFTWEPSAVPAEMYLFVQPVDTLQSEGRVFRIEDNGEYGLDLNSLGYLEDIRLDIRLARWTTEQLDLDGNLLDVQTTAESRFVLDFYQVGTRSPIDSAGGCLPAPPVLPEGGHYGTTEGLPNLFTPLECLQSGNEPAGNEAVYTVAIPPRHRMDVVYRQLLANGAMYLLDTCSPDAVCLDGADRGFGLQAETLSAFNPSAVDPLEYILVLDSEFEFNGGLFYVDLDYVSIPEPDLQDTCAEAELAPPLLPGEYFSQITTLTDQLNPGFLGCTQTPLPGQDGTRRIVMPGMSTLTVTLESLEEADLAMYLTEDCNDLGTCLVGTDEPGFSEELVYINNSVEQRTLFLTLDSSAILKGYTLDIDIQ